MQNATKTTPQLEAAERGRRFVADLLASVAASHPDDAVLRAAERRRVAANFRRELTERLARIKAAIDAGHLRDAERIETEASLAALEDESRRA